MIFPRGAAGRQRYHRHKVIAVLVTFAVLWGAVKLLPRGTLFGRLDSTRPTPAEAFRERRSGATVHAVAVVEKALSDSLVPGSFRGLRRWRMRSTDGHPFTLLQDPGGRPASAAPGDTLTVTGVYRWDTTGGIVQAVATEAAPLD